MKYETSNRNIMKSWERLTSSSTYGVEQPVATAVNLRNLKGVQGLNGNLR